MSLEALTGIGSCACAGESKGSYKKRRPNDAAVREKPATIHWWMVTVYGEKCVSDKSVRKWSARFRAGRESVGDDQRPGQANTVITSDLIDKEDDLVAISEGVCRLGSEAAHRPVKETAYGTSTATSFSVSGRPRVHEADRHSREVSRQGVAHFFDVEGPILVEFLEHRKSTNSDVYCETLRRLRRSIKNKRPGLLTEGVVLLHDNAHPHVSRVTQMELDKFKWETLDHPPYSPDILPCDFHVFGPLKKHLKGKLFNSDDILKDTVNDWVSSQPQEFWEQGILWLVHQWDRYDQAYGVYFE
ncbi:histone-lysine N-methyltransferase SETMAR [Trichonephila clavipes]|nr:histone-lysine N-methyltransferase SETMAR [Trichonephila clavipes]